MPLCSVTSILSAVEFMAVYWSNGPPHSKLLFAESDYQNR
jgi:hypothetical protein